MKLPNPKRFPLFLCFACALFSGVAHAQKSDSLGLSAWIKIPSNEDAFEINIHQISADGKASMSLAGRRERRLVDLDRIEKIHLTHPPAVGGALDRLEKHGTLQTEQPALRAYCNAILPLLEIPENNVAPVVDRYRHSLHHLGETEWLRELYTALSALNVSTYAKKADAWLAYLDIREGKNEAAHALFSDPGIQTDTGELFFLQQLARCRIKMSAGEFRQAIDHSARVIALGSIEDPLYPEAQYLSALCYDGLAEKEHARLQGVREEAVEKELLLERVRVALDLEAEADRTGAPPPTEQDILDAVDPQTVQDRVPPVPPVNEQSFALIAQKLYLFNEQVFPSTHWGQKSGDKVWPETRETIQHHLKAFTLPDLPNELSTKKDP